MGILNTVFNRNVERYEEAFQAADITSDAMKAAIAEWFALYFHKEKTEEEDPCQQIPYAIVHKLTKTTFAEYEAKGTDDFVKSLVKALDSKRKKAMQMALIGGESWLKPVPTRNGFRFGVVSRDNILVFARDGDGMLLDVGAFEYSTYDKSYFTLLERRTVDGNGYLTIRNQLYRSKVKGILGTPAQLKDHPGYANLRDVYTFPEPVGSIGMAPLRTPMENCVDGSEDAVSVYAPAVGLIHNINRNEAQLNGEFERSQSRIIASDDMLGRDKKGKRVLKDNTFVGLDGDPEDTGLTIFAPTIREQSFLARKQDYLRSAESIIGLKRGLLSEVEAVERTAKEITSSEGDYSLTIVDFQQVWEDAAKEALRLCGVLGRIYQIPGTHDIGADAVTFDWGNGILYDEEKARQQRMAEVQAGLLQPERYLGFTYKLPCDTSAQRAKIRKDYMPEVLDEPEEDE